MKRYANINLTTNQNPNRSTIGVQYRQTNIYPEIPLNSNDIYVSTNFLDRLDLMANQFYGDSTLYWVIASANPDKVDFGSLSVAEGTQLRIPININEIIRSYKLINKL